MVVPGPIDSCAVTVISSGAIGVSVVHLWIDRRQKSFLVFSCRKQNFESFYQLVFPRNSILFQRERVLVQKAESCVSDSDISPLSLTFESVCS